MDIDDLITRIRKGDVRAISRTISLIENNAPSFESLLEKLFPYTGSAYRIGITGPPGAGKSTITARLTEMFRRQNQTVGVIAVDPTSPFTGGALLGDRIRMVQFSSDPGVFVRSMASRGSAGGLSTKAQEVADVLDAAGKNVILLETVGVGQTELEIAHAADTTVVILVPESGDAVQMMKAGLMEIADIFAINKTDRPGAEALSTELQQMLTRRYDAQHAWQPPVILTVATTGEGIPELLESIRSHKKTMEEKNLFRLRREKRFQRRVKELVNIYLNRSFWTPERKALLEQKVIEISSNHTSPYELARKLLEDFTEASGNP